MTAVRAAILLPLLGLVAPFLPLPGGTADAAATLRVDCSAPDRQNTVTCRVSGTHFHPHERISITYRITFTALPRRHGRFPVHVYRRAGVTDRRGAFIRPALRFAVRRYHESFRLTVTVAGANGDRSSVTFVAIAQ